jgi:hypothetical protein
LIFFLIAELDRKKGIDLLQAAQQLSAGYQGRLCFKWAPPRAKMGERSGSWKTLGLIILIVIHSTSSCIAWPHWKTDAILKQDGMLHICSSRTQDLFTLHLALRRQTWNTFGPRLMTRCLDVTCLSLFQNPSGWLWQLQLLARFRTLTAPSMS